MNEINDRQKDLIKGAAPDQTDEDATVLAQRPADDDDATVVREKPSVTPAVIAQNSMPLEVTLVEHKDDHQKAYIFGLVLPAVFLTVVLLGGLRLSAVDNSFIFLPPPLFCLIFAVILIVLFARAGMIRLQGWFSESFSLSRNLFNGWLLFCLFAASAQLFNSLLPEQGMPFWVVGFCFLWTLWNNLFAEFDPKRLVRSLGALFGLAFVVKYLLLANLTAPEGGSWLSRIIENPGKEAFTWLLDLPRFSAGTGYIQFFTAALYFVGLLLLPSEPDRSTAD